MRDDVVTAPGSWMGPEGAGADKVLAQHRGTAIEKALLLQAMLAAVDQPSGLVWVRDRDSGQVDLSVVNPLWFDRFLVEVDLGTDRLVLDPADQRLGFGRLSPRWEGAVTLVLRRRGQKLNVEPLRLRRSSAAENVRRAQLQLELDAEGRLTGHGTLHLTGHHAWRRMGWGESPEETSAAWTAWLEELLAGYDVSDLVALEDLDGGRVDVEWKVRQHDEDVLGDEASLLPSLPLGGGEHPFTLPPERRTTPVAFAFPDLDEVELRLSWPPGWEHDVVPRGAAFAGPAGRFEASVKVDEPARQLVYRRSFEVAKADYSVEEYEGLRELYEAARLHDAQELVLIHP